jgi:Tol biopolymer transport system component
MWTRVLTLGVILAAAAPAAIVMTQASRGRSRVVVWDGGPVRVITGDFANAADPDVSFDGRRILFAAQRAVGERWQIFEMDLEGGRTRQLTRGASDCRQPVYLSRLFDLEKEQPWYEAAFVSAGAIESVKLDGSRRRRLSFVPGLESDPTLLPEGRVIFTKERRAGVPELFGINLDGTDYAMFAPAPARMASPARGRELVYVEGGRLAALSLDRPLGGKRWVTRIEDGEFRWPADAEGGVLVSRRRAGGSFGIWKIDPAGGTMREVFDDAAWDDLQAKELAPRAEPDGRGSVVDEKVPAAHFYCLSVYTTDRPEALKSGAKRVRVLTQAGVLGEAPVEEDGSFHVETPANLPVRFQLLSGGGAVLRTSSWVYARNMEKRGCIGCHEDPELAPENREAMAVIKPAVRLARQAKKGAR